MESTRENNELSHAPIEFEGIARCAYCGNVAAACAQNGGCAVREVTEHPLWANGFAAGRATRPPALELVGCDELAGILRAGYRSIIVEADEWRPLADHVLALMRGAAEGRFAPALESGAVERAMEALEAVAQIHRRYCGRVGVGDEWAKSVEAKVRAALAELSKVKR